MNRLKEYMGKLLGISVRIVVTIFLFFFTINSLHAQLQNLRIPKNKYALPGGYDTNAVKQVQENSTASIGLQETPIDTKTYIVGPGDVLSIFIQKTTPVEYALNVKPDGTIVLPEIGVIHVAGKSLGEAGLLVKKRVLQILNAQNVEVALSKIRTFKVTVLGAVRKPGTLSATPADRLHEVLDRAGGLLTTSSLRNITISREGSTSPHVDLQKFYSYGDKSNSPFMEGGDIIYIPFSSQKGIIKVNGEVNEQNTFEYKEGDKLSDAIVFAGWFTPNSDKDSVEVYRYDSNLGNKKIFVNCSSWEDGNRISGNEYNGDIILKENDKIFVRKKKDMILFDEVAIGGEIQQEGRYVIVPGKSTVLDVINESGGIKKEADLARGGLVRREDAYDPDYEFARIEKIPPDAQTESERRYYRTRLRQFRGLMLIDFEKLLMQNDLTQNLLLRPGDSIFIPRKVDYITVTGRVAKPGRVLYRKELTVSDYINLCGGFATQAEESEVFILRSNGESVKGSDITYLKPQDEIMVPEKESNPRLFLDIMTVVTQIITIAAVVVSLSR